MTSATSAVALDEERATNLGTPYHARSEPSYILPLFFYDPIEPTSATIGQPVSDVAWSSAFSSPFGRSHSVEMTTRNMDTAVIGAIAGTFLIWSVAAIRRRPPVVVERGTSVAGVAGHPKTVLTVESPAAEVRRLRDSIQLGSNLSRGEIAAITGVDRRSLSGWITGETVPTEVNFSRLRALGHLVRKLNARDITDLHSVMRDADTAEVVTAAIRAGEVERALNAVCGPTDEGPLPGNVPVLSAAEWTALVRLATAATVMEADVESDVDEDDPLGAGTGRRPRLHIDASSYRAPHRPRRETPGS